MQERMAWEKVAWKRKGGVDKYSIKYWSKLELRRVGALEPKKVVVPKGGDLVAGDVRAGEGGGI